MDTKWAKPKIYELILLCPEVYQAPKKVISHLQSSRFIIFSWGLLYEKQIIKLYLNSTFILPIVLLTFNSKLETIYGLKDWKRINAGLWFYLGTRGFKTTEKSEPHDRLLIHEQFLAPCIFPRLFSLLARPALSHEAMSHFLWRYFHFIYSPQPSTHSLKVHSKIQREYWTRLGDVVTVVVLI